MPAFVYLIPAISFFGLGEVPGVIATMIFAIPPGRTPDRAGHQAGRPGDRRGRRGVRHAAGTRPHAGAASARDADDHDRRQPGDHAVAVDGRHRRHGRRRRARRERLRRDHAVQPGCGRRVRPGRRAAGHHPGPHDERARHAGWPRRRGARPTGPYAGASRPTCCGTGRVRSLALSGVVVFALLATTLGVVGYGRRRRQGQADHHRLHPVGRGHRGHPAVEGASWRRRGTRSPSGRSTPVRCSPGSARATSTCSSTRGCRPPTRTTTTSTRTRSRTSASGTTRPACRSPCPRPTPAEVRSPTSRARAPATRAASSASSPAPAR